MKYVSPRDKSVSKADECLLCGSCARSRRRHMFARSQQSANASEVGRSAANAFEAIADCEEGCGDALG